MSTMLPEAVQRLLDQAFDVGVNIIDTAECYGQSEELIGRSIQNLRSRFTILTKCGHAAGYHLPDWHPKLLMQSIERSLRRLRTDYIDVLQLHNCPKALLYSGKAAEVLKRAQQQGKVRYLGYSGDRDDALAAVRSGIFDTLQTTVNIADQEALDQLLPLAHAQGMGILVKHPLANVAWKAQRSEYNPTRRTYQQRLKTLQYDFLRGPDDQAIGYALRFIHSIPEVDVALVGTTRPERLRQNLKHLAAGSLSPIEFENIRERWRAATRWRKYFPGSQLGWHARV